MRIHLYLFIFFLLTISISCSKDTYKERDNEVKNNLIGLWECEDKGIMLLLLGEGNGFLNNEQRIKWNLENDKLTIIKSWKKDTTNYQIIYNKDNRLIIHEYNDKLLVFKRF